MSVDTNLEPMQMEMRGLTERRIARVEEHLAAENAQDLNAIMATFDHDPMYEVEAEAVVHEGSWSPERCKWAVWLVGRPNRPKRLPIKGCQLECFYC